VQEDVCLCEAYVNVTENVIVGTDQTWTKLWERVFEKFELLRVAKRLPQNRVKPTNLQNRWASKIKPDVGLICNKVQQVSALFVYLTVLCFSMHM
jgi:hypothetical protein